MKRITLYLIVLALPSIGFGAPNYLKTDIVPQKMSKPRTVVPEAYDPHPTGKPDIIVDDIIPYTQRGSMVGSVDKLFTNEPLELNIRIKNIFAEYGYIKNNFRIKVQFKYGYSGPVHKEKIILVKKEDLEPGESLTKRVVYGRVKGTPDVLYIKVIADSTNAVEESRENNNIKEIEIRIVKKH
ncbi:CARDB domain-containing protein [Sulfurimonas sp.]|uniref:CARDB domain-containing protein n=1 Tax=Sulfurimonas sp. TaxID=2022749 RepID=UPI0026281522|nr:CARDB domain-containing protein [Sulfurimonas sp.]MCW8895051.1 hypothetical protein [Sulfurimonas sp.]MCW9068465.1 hypothetical protein [Sulfurimonas sp.]